MSKALAALLAAAAIAAHAGDDACRTSVPLLTRADALAATRARLAAGGPLTVVAIGSSSTQGFGSSQPDRTYPAQLETRLRERYPHASVRVINKGIGGDTVVAMLARFERDVLAEQPQLVVWQTGANDAMRGVSLETFSAMLDRGLDMLQEAGIDVVLMTPQYAPKVAAAPHTGAYLARMYEIAQRHHVPMFRRYDIMRASSDATRATLLDPDRLHQNDLGYRCLAEQLATAIDRAASTVTVR